MTKPKTKSGNRELAAVVLAAGRSVRMQSEVPKVLHSIAGLPLLAHVANNLAFLNAAQTVVVASPGNEGITALVPGSRIAVQVEPRGTADAVECASRQLADFLGDILIVYGDSPFLSSETMGRMLDIRRAEGSPAVVVLGFEAKIPGNYGRLIEEKSGKLVGIVEAADATNEQLEINFCNSGVMVVDARHLCELLADIDGENAKGERYLTDIVRLACARGLSCAAIRGEESELLGVDTRADLAYAESVMQERLRRQAMASGVTLIDPATVFLSHDTRLGRDVVLEPGVYFGSGVTVGDRSRVRAYSHIEGANIGADVTIGPFARLRPGTCLDAESRVGNFVEVKNATLGKGAKANHLTYLGDADIGAGANIGAGTITCNYDGFSKSKTVIGEKAFVGSNTALVAPLSVGAGSVVGAGSTITSDVPENSLALARSEQKESRDWATRRRAGQAGKKKRG